MKPEPMEIDEADAASEWLKFVAECEELGRSSAVKEDLVRKLINLWDKLRNGYKQADNVDKCLESLLIYTAKLIFNVQYSKPLCVPSGCKLDLKKAINDCGDAFSDSAKRKNICIGITSVICNPWSYDAIKKALKDGFKNVSNEDVDELWNTEGWILLETRTEYFCKIGSKNKAATGHMCFFLNVLVQRGRQFYDSKNGMTKTSDVYDPFKFSYSKYLEYLEVYTIMASEGYFEAQNITTWSSKTILEVINGLDKKALDSNSDRLFSKLKFWKGAWDATLFLAKAATWNALKSEESEMVHEYFTEWLRLNEFTKKDESPLDEIIEKFTEITSTPNVYRIANAAVEYFGKTKSITTNYVGIYIRAMTKDVNTIEDIKISDLQTGKKEKIRLLNRKLALSYVQLARFFKQYPNTSKECLLTAYSLYPCLKLFECLFPKSEHLTNISSCKTEEDDFLVEELADMRDVQFDVDTSAEDDLPLPEAERHDLESIIQNPRYKGLFRWNSAAEHERLCWQLLKDESLDVIENKKLEYVNVDYEKYKDLPSQYDPDDDGIEKGYRKGESRNRCRAYNNSKLIRRPVKGVLATRKAQSGSTSNKLITAFGTARRGRPKKPRMQSGTVKMTNKTIKYNSVTAENDLVRYEGPNIDVSKSPWFPVDPIKYTRLAYGELYHKYIRTHTHSTKEITLKKDFRVENELVDSVHNTVFVTSTPAQTFQQTRDCVPPMGSCQNPIMGQHVDSQLFKQDEDPPSSSAVDSSSYSFSNVQPFSSSMSAMHAASTYDQSQNVFEQLSRSHHQSSSPSAMTSPEAQLKQLQQMVVAKIIEMASARNPLSLNGRSPKLHKFPRELKSGNEANVTRAHSNPKRRTYPGRQLKENKAEESNDVVKPDRKRRKQNAPLESYHEEILGPIDDMGMKPSLSHPRDAMSAIANDGVNVELSNKISDESVGAASSSEEKSEALVQPEPFLTESCQNNSTLAEDNSNKVASVPTPEVLLPDFNCAFQFLGMYKKGEEANTGTTMSKIPSVLPAPKRNVLHAEVVGGKTLKTAQRSQVISPFQHGPVTTFNSQTMHRPGGISSQPVVTPKHCYPPAGKAVLKQKKIKVIAVRRPPDAYTTVSKVPESSSLRQKDVLDASSGLICTAPITKNTIVPSFESPHDAGNIQSSQANLINSSQQENLDNANSNTENRSTISKEKDAVVLQGEHSSSIIPNPSDYHKPGMENNLEKIGSLADHITIQDSSGAESRSVNVITPVPVLPIFQLPQQQFLMEQNVDTIVPSPNTNDDKNESKSSSLVNELKYVGMQNDKPKKEEKVENQEPSTTGDNNSKVNTEDISLIVSNRDDDRSNDKEDSTAEPSITAHKHTDTETKKLPNCVTVNLNMFQQPLLISCLSSIAKKKDIKVGDPDYAKKKANQDASPKSEKVLTEPTQIPDSGTQTSQSGASGCQEVLVTDSKPSMNTQQINAVNADTAEKQHKDNQLKEAIHEEYGKLVSNDNYQRSLSPTSSNNCGSITPPPSKQTALGVLPVTETPQVTEQREDSQTNVNVSISSKHMEVMSVVNENDNEVSECLSQVISKVESTENSSLNPVSSLVDDVKVLKSEIDVKITASNYETFVNYNEKKAVITENQSAHEPEVPIEENYKLHFCNETKAENVNEGAFANVYELPQQVLVNNLQKCEERDKNLTGELQAVFHKTEETSLVADDATIVSSAIVDSNPSLITIVDTEEQTAGVNQSDNKIQTIAICDSKSELDFNRDVTTDVDEGPPPSVNITNECKAPRSLTPVKQIEALYEEVQLKLRSKKRPYEDEDIDKLKLASSVVQFFEQHGGSLKRMFTAGPKLQKLSNKQIPPKFHSKLNIKRSSRILGQKQKPTKTIRTLFQSTVPKVDESSSSKVEKNSIDDDDDIVILEEIEIQSQRSSSQRSTNTGSRRNKKSQPPSTTIFSNQNGKDTVEVRQGVDSASLMMKSDPILGVGNVATTEGAGSGKRKKRSVTRKNHNRLYCKPAKKVKFTNADNGTIFEVVNEQQCNGALRVDDDNNSEIRSPNEDAEECESATESPKPTELMCNDNESYPHMEFPPSSPEESGLDDTDPLCMDDCSIINELTVSSKDHIILDSDPLTSEANEEYDTLANENGLKGGTTVQTSDMQQMHTPNDFKLDDDQSKSNESKSEKCDDLKTVDTSNVPQDQQLQTLEDSASETSDIQKRPTHGDLKSINVINVPQELKIRMPEAIASETANQVQQTQTRDELKAVDISHTPHDQRLQTSEHFTTSESSNMQHEKQIESTEDIIAPEINEIQQHQQVQITEDISEMQGQNEQMRDNFITPDIEESDICDPELQTNENFTLVNLVTPSYTSVAPKIHDSEDSEQFKNDDYCNSPSDNQVVEIAPNASSQSTSHVVRSKTDSTTTAMSPKSDEYEDFSMELFDTSQEVFHAAEVQQAMSMASSEDLIDCITNKQFKDCDHGVDAKVLGAEDTNLFEIVCSSTPSQPIDCHLNEQATDKKQFSSSSSEEKQQQGSSTTQIFNDSKTGASSSDSAPLEIYVSLESHVNPSGSNCDDLNRTEVSQSEQLGCAKANVKPSLVPVVDIDMEEDDKWGGSKDVLEEMSSTSVMDNTTKEIKGLVTPTNYSDCIRTEFPVIPPKLVCVDEILINSHSDDEPPVLEKQINYNAD